MLLQHNRLTTIEGLEFFDKLQYLVVSHNTITELTAMGHLRSLQYLDASHNLIERAPAARELPAASARTPRGSRAPGCSAPSIAWSSTGRASA